MAIVSIVRSASETLSSSEAYNYFSIFSNFAIYAGASKGFLPLVTFIYLVTLPYSQQAQLVLICRKEKITSSYQFGCLFSYLVHFLIPFWEIYIIWWDTIRFLNKLIKDEQVSLPNYPLWYNPLDSHDQVYACYRNRKEIKKTANFKKSISKKPQN